MKIKFLNLNIINIRILDFDNQDDQNDLHIYQNLLNYNYNYFYLMFFYNDHSHNYFNNFNHHNHHIYFIYYVLHHYITFSIIFYFIFY